MNDSAEPGPPGNFDTRYLAFVEPIVQLRPRLHRYCACMTGSVLGGEDVVQDALFEAYRKLDQYDDRRPLAPWLFRIAQNRWIDFLTVEKERRNARIGRHDSVLKSEYETKKAAAL